MRRDLRWEDNAALYYALKSDFPVQPVFIFDELILSELPKNDARVNFIYNRLIELNDELKIHNSSILVLKGKPIEIWVDLIEKYSIDEIFVNKDYEPYAINRDKEVENLVKKKDIKFSTFKDQVIFEETEIVKDDGKPYTIFTPYKKKWLKHFSENIQKPFINLDYSNLKESKFEWMSLSKLGFEKSNLLIRPYNLSDLKNYSNIRNFPALDQTSYLSVHLRFGTIGIRQLVQDVKNESEIFLSELIWREFFKQILFHFPKVINQNFHSKFNFLPWRNNEIDFESWCQGKTGYPMVDAGMRELNQTGYMHNRVRMIVASFLTKHLLIDWRWGEAYFAKKLLDYDLSSNNGNWQWAAGTGCDASPYYRIFNPTEQQKKFDKEGLYIKKWINELDTLNYSTPIVEHKFARTRALAAYKLTNNFK